MLSFSKGERGYGDCGGGGGGWQSVGKGGDVLVATVNGEEDDA